MSKTRTGRVKPPEDVPIQSVNKPILCSPYNEPEQHWKYDTQTGAAHKEPGRRPASYWYKTERTGTAQKNLFTQEQSDDLPLVNALREDVKRWRETNYDGATPVTRQLLAHWNRPDRVRRLFFCQREAVETVIYLSEVLGSGRKPRWKPALTPENYQRLLKGERPEGDAFALKRDSAFFPKLIDKPNEANLAALMRYGCKMATGSGKTVVMSMLVAWAFCNRGRVAGDVRFPNAAVAVCPNLTIKERLQVLRPEDPDNYYVKFDIVPSQLMPELLKGKVLVTNWHAFAPESEHTESGKNYAIVNKGAESAEAFVRRVLGAEIFERGPIMVLNDEAHHAYRPAPIPPDATISKEEREEREEATIWVSGLDRINAACGVKCCIDLSATPFYLRGSGYIEGAPLPWLVSDFGLVDAIESGIVKIPRLPVSDTTGRPEAKYFRLWRNIVDHLQPGEKLSRGRPKPEAVWRDAQDALNTLASQWKERFGYYAEREPGKAAIPPVMIIVCDNTDIAETFYRNISGETEAEDSGGSDADGASDDDADTEAKPATSQRRKKAKSKIIYGSGAVFPDLLSNREGMRATLRIDSKLLKDAESETGNKQDAADALRKVVSTVGKHGEPGEQVRCVVSVQMLTEGWDANNVTQILGLRAFDSQLLCEQVIGRGLRRMNYDPDPATGMLTEEYVDVYGIPFSLIPFRGREVNKPAPDDRPDNQVQALPDRAMFEMEFPVVEGFVFALKRNVIRADVAAMQPLVLAPDQTPTAVFVKPAAGYQEGTPTLGGFDAHEQGRQEYYASNHSQTINFEIAKQVVEQLTESTRGKLRMTSRHQLFPQVLRIVSAYVEMKVDFRGCHPCEIGLETYARKIVERVRDAIEPDQSSGEPPLLPILNRYEPKRSTRNVSFTTKKPCFSTIHSHISHVVADTATWEQSAAFRIEQAVGEGTVKYYARNDRLDFTIPYEFLGVSHPYTPDFLLRLADDSTVILEIKGQEDEQDRAKHQAAQRWVKAVNNWGKLGRWRFRVCYDPQRLKGELRALLDDAAETLSNTK